MKFSLSWRQRLLQCAIASAGVSITCASTITHAQSTNFKDQLEKFEDYQVDYTNVPGEVVVKFSPENGNAMGAPGLNAPSSIDAILSKVNGKSPRALQKARGRAAQGVSPATPSARNIPSPLENTFVISIEGMPAEQAAKILKDEPGVVFAEPNYRYKLHAVPNDPFFSSSGSFNNTFNDLYGLHQINAEYAWDTEEGAGVVVAVVDSGVDLDHVDLADNIWTNVGEIADNGIDDDGNGYIDDVYGWNFHDDNNDPNDDFGHGTHVAGTIAAVGNNLEGVIGVAPESLIMPVRVLGNQQLTEEITVADLAEGVTYAVDNGADVINASWGGPHSQIIADVVNYAYEQDVVFVASAGNDGIPTFLFSPAGLADAITVAANDHNDAIANFSNWGAGLDITGPGVAILSTAAEGANYNYNIGEYGVASGTSMSAPHVSGAVALIRAAYPNYNVEQVRYALRESAADIELPGYDLIIGHGRLDADAALDVNDAPRLVARLNIADPDALIANGHVLTGTASGDDFASYSVEIATPVFNAPLTYETLATGTAAVESNVLAALDFSNYDSGWYMLRLTVFTADGRSLSAESFTRIDHDLKSGWPQDIPNENILSQFSPNRAVSFADLDGDGEDEVIATSYQTLHVWRADGSAFPGFPVTLPSPSAGAVSIYDVNQDGDLDIITPLSALDGSGEIAIYDNYGYLLFGYPLSTGLSYDEGVVQLDFSRSVSVQDVDGDSIPELVFVIKAITGTDVYYGYKVGKLYAGVMRLDGSFVGSWPQQIGFAAGYQSGETLVIDRDGDGDKELLFVSGVSSAYGSEYFFQEYSHTGEFTSNMDFPELRNASPRNSLLHTAHATDLDSDGIPEIALITGDYMSSHLSVSLLDSNFNILPGWPRVLPGHSWRFTGSPGVLPIRWPIASLNMDNDAAKELVYMRGDAQYIFNKDGSLISGSPIVVSSGTRLPEPYEAVYAPTAEEPENATFYPNGSYIYAVDKSGNDLQGWRRYQGSVAGSIAVGNIDNDDTLEVASLSSKGKLYIWEVALNPGQNTVTDWQTFGGNNQRSFHNMIETTPSYTSVKPSMFVRGSVNGWGTQEMSLVANNTWEAMVSFNGSELIKFDVLGDWSDNYGDNNADNIADTFGNNIAFTGIGDYRVQFNDSTLAYSITPAGSTTVGANCLYPIAKAVYGDLSHENFSLTCKNGIWSGSISSNTIKIVFTDLSDLTHEYGDANNDGVMGINEDYAVIDFQGASSGIITFDPSDLTYSFAPTTQNGSCNFSNISIRYLPNSAATYPFSDSLTCENGAWVGEFDLFPSILSDFHFSVNYQAYGDSDNNGILESGETYLNLPQGEGRYAIEVNDNTLAYSLTRLSGVNQAPIISIAGGLNISLDPSVENVFTIDASATTDPDGDELSFYWSVNNSAGFSFLTTDSAVSKIIATAVPESIPAYQRLITLTVTDSKGLSTTEVIHVEQVHDPLQLTTADAGADIVVPLSGGTVSLNGSISGDVAIEQLFWSSFGSGVLYSGIADRNSLTTDLTVPAASDPRTTYLLSLTVRDANGGYAYDTLKVSYEADTTPEQNFPSLFVRGNFNSWAANTPMMLVGDNLWEMDIIVPSGTQGIKFDVLGDWTQNYGDNNNDGYADAGGDNIAITQGAGTYTVSFNDANFTYSVVKQVVQQAPVANAGVDQNISSNGGIVTLNGSSSFDPDGSIVSSWWVQISGPVVQIASPASLTTSITLPSVTETTSYTFSLYVEDNDGLSSTDTVVITQDASGFSQNYDQVYARGTFNSWGTTLMTLVGNNLWQTTVTLDGTANPRMKFDIYGDWSLNFGDNNGDNIADQTGNDILFPTTTGTYTIQFNDQTRAYSLVQ